MQFVPLPSRHLIDDAYYSRFTLLGQSLGSLYLAYQGLCGKDGLWGDIFLGQLTNSCKLSELTRLDSMGYAFTYPLVRLITGSEVTIGSYIHYPTVSADMVRRVRERSFGVENAGASKSWLRTQIKLV
jgi:alpha-1,2-mannosyltransferase